MGAESSNRVGTLGGGVFLSYASQDEQAARRICDALREGGIEVWFDQSELRGGDVWDRKIRQQIRDCALFVPIVSQHTQERLEGYFRLEWRLAVDRSHLMAIERPFLVPVIVDGTRDQEAVVPDEFRAVQWTRLPAGDTPPAFVEHVRRLLSSELFRGTTTIRPPASAASGTAAVIGQSVRASWGLRPVLLALIAAAVSVALAYLVIDKNWFPKQSPTSQPMTSAAPEANPRARTLPATFAPPLHSIAVLPFVNMSGDKEQDYFSDGLSEELLNSLSRMTELQVAGRTSSFYFKGKDVDLSTVAHKLNVATVLEGSVRRSSHTVRVTAQLINALTGFHLWSQTYDRSLGDVLALQTEIADAVTSALKVTFLGGAAAKVEVGATRNPAAFDAYLRGLRLARVATNAQDCRAPVDAFTEAIRYDSNYALAFARRALTVWECASHYTGEWLQQQVVSRVRADAERAIALAPGLADGHVALSSLESGLLEFASANESCGRALALAPGNGPALYHCSRLAGELGQTDAAIAAARRGVALDPLNPSSHRALGDTLRYARRYDEAIAAYQDSIAVDPEHSAEAYARRGLSHYLAGNLSRAQSSCEAKPNYYESCVCQAMFYDRVGRQNEAAEALKRVVQQGGDGAAYQYAQIYTQWHQQSAALDWLEKALRLGDPGLIYLRIDPLLDPLRKEPRFQAIERALKFPD